VRKRELERESSVKKRVCLREEKCVCVCVREGGRKSKFGKIKLVRQREREREEYVLLKGEGGC
jgi:hypothetical protein